jgi:hypothetical protein
MSTEGFLKVIDAELAILESELQKTRIPKSRDKLMQRISELRITKSSAVSSQAIPRNAG